MPRLSSSTFRPLFALALSIVVLSGVSAPAFAQLTEVQPGARVRVQAPGIVAGRYVGTVLTRSADTLELGTPGTAPIKVALARISSIEVSRGSSRSLGAMRGVAWGAPIGLVIGVIAATGTESDPYCFDNCSTSGSDKAAIIAASTLGGALWGAGIGALIGRERWERFDVAPRSSLDARHGKATLGFAVPF